MPDENQPTNSSPPAPGSVPTNPVPDLVPPDPAPVDPPPSVPPTPSIPSQTVDPIAPASVPTQGAQMPPPAAPQTRYAGFWIRFLASIIDGFILGIVGSIVQAVFGGVFGAALLSQPSEPTAGTVGIFAGIFSTMVLILTAIEIAYYVGLTGTYGATLGKMILGLRVVDANGQKIGLGKAALREIVGKFVSGIVFGLGYLWVAFDEKKQGWHDKIAGTYVVKIR